MTRLAPILALLAALAAPAPAALAAPRPAADPDCAPPLLAHAPVGPRSGLVPSTIRVEIDYMVKRDARGNIEHSHRPRQAEIDAVIRMFACQGITLIVEVSDEIEHVNVLKRDPDDADNFFDYTDFYEETSFEGIKDAHADHAPGTGWHYAVFGHQYQSDEYDFETGTYKVTGSSGLAEVGGDDFIVTLGNFFDESGVRGTGTAWDRAATLAHELGHNLGLRHAGDMNPDAVGEFVPNVPSVMSYFHQLTGIRTALQCNGLISGANDETGFKELDYSHGRACTLIEYGLDEDRGMGIVAVDWDCDGTIGGLKSVRIGNQDDGWCGAGRGVHGLADYNEWANIEDNTSIFRGAERLETIACVTHDEIVAYRAHLDETVARLAVRITGPDSLADPPLADPLAAAVPLRHCPQATLTTESCARRGMRYIATNGSPASSGLSCRSPVLNPTLGVGAANAGDVLYLAPGTYPGALTITKQVKLLGPGGAVLGGQ